MSAHADAEDQREKEIVYSVMVRKQHLHLVVGEVCLVRHLAEAKSAVHGN